MNLNDFVAKVTGIDKNKALEARHCALCEGQMGPYRDEISEREAKISQTCQKCQDEMFV